MAAFYFIVIFALSLLQPIMRGMEISIGHHQTSLFPIEMPSDPVCILMRYLVQLDAQEYIRSKTTNQRIEDKKLHTLHKGYLSFSQSLQNLLNACPSVISIVLQINRENPFFLLHLRTDFFIKAKICPSGHFVNEFLKNLNPNVHSDRLHNAFYSLTASKRFCFVSPLHWAEAPIEKVPFGYNILFMRHHKQYNDTKLPFPHENPYNQIASIFYNPYIDIKTKHKNIKRYLLSVDANQKYKTLLLKRTRTLKEKIKKKGSIDKSLDIVVHYLLQAKEKPYWVGGKNKRILYWYLEKDLNNPYRKNSSLTNILKNAIEKRFNPKDELINLNQFADSQAILLDLFRKINPKAVALLRGIFQEHSVSDILRIFTYFPEYWSSIDTHMKCLNDTHEIFYSQHFNKLIQHTPKFDTIFKKDFNLFVSFLEQDLKKCNRYYPRIKSSNK